jgi:hypothetical protein
MPISRWRSGVYKRGHHGLLGMMRYGGSTEEEAYPEIPRKSTRPTFQQVFFVLGLNPTPTI